MTAKRPSKNRGKARTSMWLSTEVLKASKKRADRLGISRGLLMEQVLRQALGLGAAIPVGGDTERNPADVFG